MTGTVLNNSEKRWAGPSPIGRRWPKGPDEGSPPHDLRFFAESWSGLPSTGAARHPLPVGEGTREKKVPSLQRRLEPASRLTIRRTQLGHVCPFLKISANP